MVLSPKNPELRLHLHNTHAFHQAYTKKATDWEIVLLFECSDKKKALYLERFVKRMKSKKFIQKIIQDPTIFTDILHKK